jgi:hypothetical protein
MWWHDITEIKEWMVTIASRITNLDVNVDIIKQTQEDAELYNSFSDRLDNMMEAIEKVQGEFPKFEALINPDELVSTYEKHIRKIEEMMLEFKGCVSMARSAIAERKELDKEFEEMKKVTKISQQIYDGMLSFIKASENLEQKKYFKIDAIYAAICEKEVKPKPKRKPAKKKVTPSP